MRQENSDTSVSFSDSDGTRVEENRQLTNLLLTNAIPAHTLAPNEGSIEASWTKYSPFEFISVVMFGLILMAYNLTIGRLEEEDLYY